MGPPAFEFLERCLVDSRYDHESCGVGFVAKLNGDPSHDILRLALTALGRLAHRGAVAADRKSSDGVGVLTAIPRTLLLKQTAIALPVERPLIVGMLFLPQSESQASRDAQVFRECISAYGLQWLAWREVPIRREVLGEQASALPPPYPPGAGHCRPPERNGRQARSSIVSFWRARRSSGRITTAMSARSRPAPLSIRRFAPDGRRMSSIPTCSSPEFVTPFAIFHQRYATNVCRRGTARSRCECWPTTARSTPSGATARTWRRDARLCRRNVNPANRRRFRLHESG